MTASWQIEATVHAPAATDGDAAPYSGPDSFTFVRLRLRDPDGVEGNGFTGRFLAHEVAHFLNRALPGILASGHDDPVAEMARTFNPRHMGGVAVSALSAFEIALTDICAKRAGQSVASFLGGKRSAAPVHVTCGFPKLSTRELVHACETEIAGGARGVKVLIASAGRGVAEDLARLKAVREALGPEPEIIADANCKMDLDTALRFVAGALDLNLTWLEEPVTGNNIEDLAQLSVEGIPIGAGQMEQFPARLAALCEARVSVIQPNAVFLGGFKAAITTAKEAASHDATISMAGGWDIVNLHWLCGAVDSGAVEMHRAQTRITRLLLDHLPEISNGQITIPDLPGLGMDPDEHGLRECRIA